MVDLEVDNLLWLIHSDEGQLLEALVFADSI